MRKFQNKQNHHLFSYQYFPEFKTPFVISLSCQYSDLIMNFYHLFIKFVVLLLCNKQNNDILFNTRFYILSTQNIIQDENL